MTVGIKSTIFEILDQSKDTECVDDLENVDTDICNDLGLSIDNDRKIRINRKKRIELAMFVIEHGANIVDVIDLLTWKDFEGLVANILSENSFRCTESFRRRGTSEIKGMEIDVIGIRGRILLSVDAKMWSVRGGKVSALRTAAENQKNRTKRLSVEFEKLSNKIPSMKSGSYIMMPIIVTWLVEEVEIHEGVPVVPIFKLNSFIQEFEIYQDRIISYTANF